MKKASGLTVTLSVVCLVIGIGATGQAFAVETGKAGTTDTNTRTSASREGGQSGKSPHLEKRSEAFRSKGEGRVGGQAGNETPLEERTSSYGSMGSTRVGGQAGVERDQNPMPSKAK